MAEQNHRSGRQGGIFLEEGEPLWPTGNSRETEAIAQRVRNYIGSPPTYQETMMIHFREHYGPNDGQIGIDILPNDIAIVRHAAGGCVRLKGHVIAIQAAMAEAQAIAGGYNPPKLTTERAGAITVTLHGDAHWPATSGYDLET